MCCNGCCNINAHNHPSIGVCLRICAQYDGPDRAPLIEQLRAQHTTAVTVGVGQHPRHFTPGALLRHIIHFLLDCLDSFVRPRARHKLWIIDQLKTCCGCIEREILIDHYCLHLWNKVRCRLGQKANLLWQ